MKRTLIVIVCVTVALAFAGVVLAEANPTGKKSTPQAPMVNKKKMMGIVESVDPAANTIVLRSKDKDIVFSVDVTAKILKGGKECRLADIRVDSRATIFYTGGGKKRVAVQIVAQMNPLPERVGRKPVELQPEKE
jgi:hypothetical protein